MAVNRLKNKGFTLVEIVVATAFVSLVIAFVVQLFFDGFKQLKMGDVEEESVRLANNEMIRLASVENPLYLGFLDDPEGLEIIERIKKGELTPQQMVEDGTIVLSVLKDIGKPQTSANNPEIKASNSNNVEFTRKAEWKVLDVNPVLVYLKVTVNSVDPREEMKDGSFMLETQLTK
jgi:type II secretory pathway pseudopilin PulG